MQKRRPEYFNYHFPLSKLMADLTTHLTTILLKCNDQYLNETIHNILYDVNTELNLAYFDNDKTKHLINAESYLHQLSTLVYTLYDIKVIYGNNYKHYCVLKVEIDESIQKWKSYVNR